jgi:MFS family permease
MRKKQLVALFVDYLTVGTIGAVTGGLLPIYATRLGADSTLAGLYISATFAAIAVGTVIAGWLSDKIQRRREMLIVSGVITAASLWWMGRATDMTGLFISSMVMFLAFGVQIAVSNILVGLFAGAEERGRVFGIMATTNPLGSLLGGAVAAVVLDRWGFPVLLAGSAAVALVVPVMGLLLEDKAAPAPLSDLIDAKPTPRKSVFSPTFLLLFFAMTIAFITIGVQGLGRTLMMDKLGFNASDVSSTLVVGGLVGIPFPLILGWLSDRMGRKRIMLICYVAMASTFLLLSGSFALWHFWLSMAIQWFVVASMGIASALVTDIVEPDSLGTALSLLGSTNFIGLVIGTGITGAAIQNLGLIPTFVMGAVLALIALGLITQIKRSSGTLIRSEQVVSTL